MADRDPNQLIGRWIHVHEEDDAGYRVFRRPGVPLPPSRGRTELEVAPDLSVRRFGPGADDRPGAATTSRIGFGPAQADDKGDYLRAISADGGRLVIAKD